MSYAVNPSGYCASSTGDASRLCASTHSSVYATQCRALYHHTCSPGVLSMCRNTTPRLIQQALALHTGTTPMPISACLLQLRILKVAQLVGIIRYHPTMHRHTPTTHHCHHTESTSPRLELVKDRASLVPNSVPAHLLGTGVPRSSTGANSCCGRAGRVGFAMGAPFE